MNAQFTRRDSLTAKGFAILLLLFYHLFYQEYILDMMQVNYAPVPKEVFLMLAGFGNICVAVFVMITAYGITKGILNAPEMDMEQAYRQAGRRFLKLLGGFIALYFSVILVWFYKFDLSSLYGSGKQGLLLLLCDSLGLAQYLNTPTLCETWWYMSLAYTFIFIVPFLAFCIKRIGNMILAIAFFLPMIFTLNNDIQRYLFVAVFGVCAAYGNWFEKVSQYKIHTLLKWILGIAGLILCILIRQNAVVKDYFWDYIDAPIAFFVICFVLVLLGNVPVLKTVLQFIGKHSMNIYLVHTFFYMILFRDFIYQFRYAWITYLLLLAVSLVYAVLLEAVKKFIMLGIDKLLHIKK